jgi:carboxypeptidase Taq
MRFWKAATSLLWCNVDTLAFTTARRLRGGSSSRSMTSSSDAYQQLLQELDSIKQLSRAASVLEYDKMVFMPMNEHSSMERGKQSAALASVIHEKSIQPKIGELLDEAQTVVTDPEQKRVVELARKEYEKKIRIPTELAARKAQLKSKAYKAWTEARAANDFRLFQEPLRECIATAIEVANCYKTTDDDDRSVYSILLDNYEVGMDPARIDQIFDQIKAALVPLIEKVLGPDATAPSQEPLQGTFDIERQKQLCQTIVKQMGFDETHGRIDVSVHPFTMSLNPHDVRITSRFRENEWYQGLAATMHEGGHAIYEQNLHPASRPIDEALSMGMHESQSLFWERHIGLSKEFWEYATPFVNEHLGTNHAPEALYGAVNYAEKSFIRVEADELTYPLHVILRYEIERDFIQGQLSVEEIPARWNSDFQTFLGLEVPSDAQGCLQDIHWSMLAYGYFPTYLLGAAAAAQLAHYCAKDIPDMKDKIEKGDFSEIKSWLTKKVHRHGKRYSSLDGHFEAELGEPLNPSYYIDYLVKKYTELYQCYLQIIE